MLYGRTFQVYRVVSGKVCGGGDKAALHLGSQASACVGITAGPASTPTTGIVLFFFWFCRCEAHEIDISNELHISSELPVDGEASPSWEATSKITQPKQLLWGVKIWVGFSSFYQIGVRNKLCIVYVFVRFSIFQSENSPGKESMNHPTGNRPLWWTGWASTGLALGCSISMSSHSPTVPRVHKYGQKKRREKGEILPHSFLPSPVFLERYLLIENKACHPHMLPNSEATVHHPASVWVFASLVAAAALHLSYTCFWGPEAVQWQCVTEISEEKKNHNLIFSCGGWL